MGRLPFKIVTMEERLNMDLRPHNTFGLTVFAARTILLNNLSEFIAKTVFPIQECVFLGGGSNILFTTNPTTALYKVELKGIEILEKTTTTSIVKVSAGENWHQFVLWTLDHQLYGLENLSLIPGTVGAAPIQNIGAYGVEVKEFITAVEVVDLQDGTIHLISNEDCAFGYRDSIFKRSAKGKYLITAVLFQLQHQATPKINYGDIQKVLEAEQITHPTPLDVSKAVIKIRQSKLPNPEEIGNAGSFFKNPVIDLALFEQVRLKYPTIPSYPATQNAVKVPAGWLIEQCGWKGYRRGQIGVHAKQALVLVNYGGGTGGEILQLARDIIAHVFDQTGIPLEMEVNVW